MGKKGEQTKISSRTIAIIATIVIVAVAFSSVAYIGLDRRTQDVVGPKIKISNEIQPFSDKNLTNATETIQVFFSSPDTMQSYSTTSIDLKSFNPYNNSYYIELFNETYSPIPNNITAFLSSNFTYLSELYIFFF
ncbi:MAG: hypothetical protein ACP5TX_05975, partial [Thermoplasmata archaeon]